LKEEEEEEEEEDDDDDYDDLREIVWKLCTGLIWLRIETSGELL
jgi:hypothetical protein